jgi:hypothetical protein
MTGKIIVLILYVEWRLKFYMNNYNSTQIERQSTLMNYTKVQLRTQLHYLRDMIIIQG